jgi:hypothetical protein
MYCLIVLPFFLQYLANAENFISSWSVKSEPTLMITNNFIYIWPCSKSHVHILSLRSFIQGIRPSPWLMFMFHNTFIFYGEGLLTPRPNPNLENHPLSSVCGYLFNVFTANLHYWRPSLYPRPEDAPCCGDRDPPNMEYNSISSKIKLR